MSEHIIAIFIVIITGAISVVGLVLSKENKISEFRQLWINDLRDSLSKLGANFHKINEINALHMIGNRPTSEDLYNLTISKLDVTLRINNNAINKRIGILTSIKKFSCKKHDDNTDTIEDEAVLIRHIERIYNTLTAYNTYNNDTDYIPFIETSSKILKKEWERVKAGELTYRFWSFIFSSLFIIAIVSFFVYVFFHRSEIYTYMTTVRTLWGG